MIDICGLIFSRLSVVSFSHIDRHGLAFWKCKCDCGKEAIVGGGKLRSGHTKSCGCLKSDLGKLRVKHGAWSGGRSPEYRAWDSMKDRCVNSMSKSYPYYGGRGIKVCDRWLDSYENFLADMGRKPSPKHSIDRISVNGNYEPGNCRWATKLEQANNTRRNRSLNYDGLSMNMSQWEARIGLSSGLIYSRLQRGWSVERALTTPVQSPK